MNSLCKEPGDVERFSRYLPNISVVLPFDKQQYVKSEWEQRLRSVTLKAEALLAGRFSDDRIRPVVEKLKTVIRRLNFCSPSRGVAIFVSPATESAWYVDFRVEENIAVNGNFRIRDILDHRRRTLSYLLLALGEEASKLYYFNSSSLTCLRTIETDIRSCQVDPPARPATDTRDRIEALQYIFCHKIDYELSLLLQEYALPVVVTGKTHMLGRFGRWTKNGKYVASYIPGEPENMKETELLKLIGPPRINWQRVWLNGILRQLEMSSWS